MLGKVNTLNMFELLKPQIRQAIHDTINFMDGIPSGKICPQRRLIKTKHLVEIQKRTDTIVNSIIHNCKRRKSLGYVVNDIMSLFQYANVNSLNLMHLFGEFRPTYEGSQDEVKEAWHSDMMEVLFKVLGKIENTGGRMIDKVYIACCEEYGLNEGPTEFSSSLRKELNDVQERLAQMPMVDPEIANVIKRHAELLALEKNMNTNTNEFETFLVGNNDPLPKSSLRCNIFHNFNIIDDKVLVNIHNFSNLPENTAIQNIINLLNNFQHSYPQYYIILCGDSNVNYSYLEGGMDSITNLGNQLREVGYNLLISRYVITKRRPRNFFQNSKSAEKGYLQNINESMFITYPTSLQSLESHEHDRFFIVGPDPIKNLKEMNPITIWAFEGSKLGFKENIEEGWEGIDICNYHEFPFSDHMPICCNIGTMKIIVANNAGIMGAKGVNYNKDKFVENIDLKYLQECSDKFLMPYFFELLRNMITSLIKTEAGISILKRDVINKFNKIVMKEEPWEQLKELATLEIC